MRHTDHRYHQELHALRVSYLEMLALGESMLQDAMRSVLDRDPDLARRVVSTDRALDQLEIQVDESCLRILALYRPVARDLRLVAAVMKSVTDLERIGDLAVNIARRGFDLARGPGLEPTAELGAMRDEVLGMLALVNRGFTERQPEVLDALRARDEQVDQLNREVLAQVLGMMAHHPDQSRRGLALTSISRALERIADHAVNLGEQVAFMVAGEDLRHSTPG